MSAQNEPKIAQKEKAAPKKTATLIWEGRRLPMEKTSGGWRVRSRAKKFPVDYSTGIHDLSAAKDDAKEHLDKLAAKKTVASKHTLHDVVTAYRAMPKRVGQRAEDLNVTWLKAIVQEARGKKLNQFPLSDLSPRLWSDFMAKRHPGGKLDLNTRRPENTTINGAVRCACSIFIKPLRPRYKDLGIVIPEDATDVQWAPVMDKEQAAFDDAAFQKEWPEKKEEDPAVWLAAGLARFAGLRRKEVMACRGHWIVERRVGWCVAVQDRPEEHFWTKGGKKYYPLIINATLLAELRKVKADELVIQPPETWQGSSRDWWSKTKPQEWLRSFTKAQKPLHRLRAAYADDIAEETATDVKAREEGLKAAKTNLGHRSVKTTEGYVTER